MTTTVRYVPAGEVRAGARVLVESTTPAEVLSVEVRPQPPFTDLVLIQLEGRSGREVYETSERLMVLD